MDAVTQNAWDTGTYSAFRDMCNPQIKQPNLSIDILACDLQTLLQGKQHNLQISKYERYDLQIAQAGGLTCQQCLVCIGIVASSVTST